MEHILPVLLIIFLATLVQSTFSFGGALISLPLLSFFIEIKTATPLMTMLSGVIAGAIVLSEWKHIRFQAAWRLIVSALAGIPLGIFFLSFLNEDILKIILSVTVIAFTILNVMKIKALDSLNINYALVFGFVSGVFGGAFNISGPPVVLYGSLSNWSPAFFRATLQSYSLATNIFSVFAHLSAGNISREVLFYFISALPVVAVSLCTGKFLNSRIPAEKYRIIVNIMLIVLGCNLLISAVV